LSITVAKLIDWPAVRFVVTALAVVGAENKNITTRAETAIVVKTF
jgi:membrane protein required for beta-lactamase induction